MQFIDCCPWLLVEPGGSKRFHRVITGEVPFQFLCYHEAELRVFFFLGGGGMVVVEGGLPVGGEVGMVVVVVVDTGGRMGCGWVGGWGVGRGEGEGYL